MPVALVPLDQVDLGLVQLLLPGAIRLADCAVALSADAQHLGLGHGHQLLLLPQGGGGQPVSFMLKRGDAVEELTDERAAELLAERRMKGPAKKKR